MNEAFAFNLNHLRYFYEVARSGNMRRAASRIGISQPALSKQIQALEESIGLQLFYRSSRGLQPTPDGEAVFLHCERVFAHLRDLEDAVEALQSGSAGRVTVGATFSIAEYILPEYIRRYHERHPKVRFRLVTARSNDVLRSLREHRVDVAFVAGNPDDESLVATPMGDNRLVVVVGPTHALAGAQGSVPVDRLHRIDMVAFDEEAPTRKLTERYLDGRDVVPRIMAESPSIETIKRLVREGVGFAVLPFHSVEEEIASGRLEIVDVEGWDLHRLLYAVHLALPALPPTVQNFVDLIPSIDPPDALKIASRGFSVSA
ncbi:MAG: LysR family transcriptional regulator [Deltaproteobacteria bacterium]|nr:MAG: LysR family transcriptional regulator [Deltaproteobacteria bacterium]